ncbi:MAG: flippase [bacterium]
MSMSQALAKNTLQLTLALIGQKLLAFIYAIVIARRLGVIGNGQYFLAFSFVSICSSLADLGINAVFIRDSAQQPEKRQSLFMTSLSLKAVLVILMVILANSAAWLLGYSTELRLMIAIVAVSAAFEATHSLFFSALRSIQQLKYESAILISGQVLQVVIGGVLMVFTTSPVPLVIAVLVTNIFNLAAATYFVRRKLNLKFSFRTSRGQIKAFAYAAAPFALAGVFAKIYSYTDSIILSKIASHESLGYYGVAYKFTYAFQFLPLAFIAGLYPAFAELYRKDSARLSQLFQRSMWYMSVLSFPLVFGVWAVGDKLIRGVYGSAYIPAIPTMYILFPVLILIFLDFPVTSLLNATHQTVIKTKIMGLTVVINVIANLILIPKMAEQGAAWAAVISFSFMYLAGLAVAIRLFQLNIKQLLITTVRVLAASLVMYFAVVLAKPYCAWYILVTIGIATYPLALFALKGIKMEDLRAFQELFRKKAQVMEPVEELPS